MRWVYVLLLLWTTFSCATTGGQSSLQTRHYYITSENYEVVYNEKTHDFRYMTQREMAQETARYWRFYLRAYRIIARSPTLQRQVHQKMKRQQYLTIPEIENLLEVAGCPTRTLNRQPLPAYTLQIAAYRNPASLRIFLSRFKKEFSNSEADGIGIYWSVTKDVCLGYADGGVERKPDYLYVTRHGQLQRLRYGIYENRADAQRDARTWQRRYHITPVIARVPVTDSLVENMI